MKIYYSSKFEREYKRLPKQIKILAEEKEGIFRNNPFDSRLKTHKLGGKLKGYRAFWIDQKYRVIFEFVKENIVWFHSVGDHSIYR
ncbi:MAG: type II toxin-antitoxin system mRNA interferase toxin, RelE/StbE family [Candidatus Colwellbacteria bacterium]|nr:type II toxin-antitoxin system mRNA interferase toxin, RelE/StbE family [Candidatus Colwellbacteria bacterium]